MGWGKQTTSFMALLLTLPACPVLAGQDITVNSNVGNFSVCGNSTNADGIAGTTQAGSTNCTDSQTNNIITIGPSGRVGGHVFGAVGGNSTGNRVIVDGGYASLDVMGGQATGTGDASKNTIIVNSGTVNRNLYGGLGSTGTTTDNTIIIKGGTIGSLGVIAGGNANRGTITGNNVIISGGTINTQIVAGGRATAAGTFILSNNSVTINADSGTAPVFSLNTILYGSHCLNSTTCTFTDNALNLSTKIAVKSAENFQIYKFDLGNGIVAGDTLLSVTDAAKISGASIALKATGNTSFMKGNQITLINKVDTNYTSTQNGVEQDGAGFVRLYDFSLNAAAGGSLVATINRSLLAAGRGSGHTYTLNDAAATGDYAGGYADGTTHTKATNNTLHITTGFTNTDTTLYGGFCKTATCADTTTGNTLQLDTPIRVKETKNFQYYHFILRDTLANDPTAMLSTEGILSLNPSTTEVKLRMASGDTPLTAGDRFVLANQASDYTGTQNGVEQDGAGFVGLYDFNLNATAGGSLVATVNRSLLAAGRGSGHTYTLNNAAATGDYAGGYADGTTQTTATNNMVHVTRSFSNTGTTLYGGFCKTATCTDTTTGNTLRLDTPIRVKETKNFQYYHFILRDTLANDLTAMLSTGGILSLNPSTTEVKLGMASGGTPLTAGDRFVLINQASDYTAKTISTVWRNGAVDETYRFDVRLDGSKQLAATLLSNDASIAPPAASALGAHGTVTAAINNDFDFMAFEGIQSAADAAGLKLNGLNSGDFDRMQGGVFATAKGGWVRSYSDAGKTRIGGSSLLAGLSANIPLQSGNLLLGTFGEGGWSRYDDTTNGIDGNGTITTFGGGVLLHYQRGRAYTEAVGRIGRANNSYHNSAARYSTHSTYYGTYVGAGYVVDLNRALSLDISSKYFWTHQTGSNPTIMGDDATFKAIDSHRWRNGARLQFHTTSKISPYIGGYYEYEFANTARGVIAGIDIPTISRQGGSGIGEIGVAFNAADTTKIDLGLNGSIGKREGIIASLKARWVF